MRADSTASHESLAVPGRAVVETMELSRQQGVSAIQSIDELSLDVWQSDEELEAFLAQLRRARQTDLA